MRKSYYLFVILLFSCPWNSWCQTLSDKSGEDTTVKRALFVINEIAISGNRKTKPYIIRRELPFKSGDSMSLPELVSRFQRAKELLINTKLFNEVVVSLKSFNGYYVQIQIDVKERWYIFPIPYLKPIDRNLSAWADKNYSLSRVNFGAKFTYYNFTGRNDKLRMWLITGYTRQIQFSYDQPYADKSLKHGFNIGFSYAALKEINASTNGNEQVFLKADSIPYSGKYLNELSNFSLGYSFRPAIKVRHSARLFIHHNKIDSAVTVKNADYFGAGRRRVIYPELVYTAEYQNVDYIPYILKGLMADITLTRKGINKDMNLWQLNTRFTRGWPLGHNTYFGLQGQGTLKLPFRQPYFNQRMFGYGDLYLRGLEKYVIDGVAGIMFRNTFRKKVLSFDVPFHFSKTHSIIPFNIYMKTYGDVGYSHNKALTENSLTNRMLYTGGAGLDVVSLYDLVLRFEYSFNQLGQSGFFFHIKNDF